MFIAKTTALNYGGKVFICCIVFLRDFNARCAGDIRDHQNTPNQLSKLCVCESECITKSCLDL